MKAAIFASILAATALAEWNGPVAHVRNGVTHQGIYENEVERFSGIRFALDTGGNNRFKPAIPYAPEPNSVIQVTAPGPACPQKVEVPHKPNSFHFAESWVTEISEDCLRLDVWRPNGTRGDDKLPVMVYIYGGSFVTSSIDDVSTKPGGLVVQSVENGHPILHVNMNYRLGVFGFAQNAALENQGAENLGLRDQRLALEWVQENIAHFGGDPDKVTIHGQSSGGLSVGMHLVAFGGDRGFPFRGGICESQVFEPGITGNVTRMAMERIWTYTECGNTTEFDSADAIDCLRKLPMKDLLHAQLFTSHDRPALNNGDEWLPVVDGEGGFLPAAPSELVFSGRFANASVMFGWCEDDAQLYAPLAANSPKLVYDWLRAYLPQFSEANIQKLLDLYPVDDFYPSYGPKGNKALTRQNYRAGRIYRDILFTCQPMFLGEVMSNAGNDVYLYNQNQSMLTPILDYYGDYGFGVIHTSDLGYIFGNLSHFNQYDWPYNPTDSDKRLAIQQSRSWASFTALGKPSLEGHGTLQGWAKAQFDDENYGAYVIGGPYQGFSGSGGNKLSKKHMAFAKLRERCGFLNSPEIVREIQY